MSLWRELVQSRFSTLQQSSEDKRMSLAEAVERFVRPGMKINPCSLQSRPSATIFEICRQFNGRDPGFEFISSSIGGTYLSLVHLGLIRKMIVSFAGEAYPTPGPSPIIARALRSGVQIENMTMLTVPQRLLAGAMGVPFITTRSLAGSSIGDELPEVFREIPDPFDPSRKAGVLKAYHPDVSFVHAWAADAAGNALCHPPYAENIYGALAARDGVILTADHMVDTEFIRRHSNLGRIPAEIVRAVCHAPYGAHPTGNFAHNVPEFVPYGNDYEFMTDHRRATRDEATYDAWLKHWVFDAKDHDGYLERLGQERIEKLHFVAQPESWREELEPLENNLSEERPANAIETMITQGARAFADRMQERGLKTVLSGVGQATLMTWLAAHRLRDAGINVALMAEIGFYGHDPRPSDPFVFNYRNITSTTMLTDIFETLGLHTGGANNTCLGAIGAAQVDKHGNVNSTRVDGKFIVGSGGANDIASAAAETIVIAQQRREQFVEKVDYITSPGQNIKMVISSMGRFEKRDGDELILTGYFERDSLSAEELIKEIREKCGWNLQVADDLEALTAHSVEETVLLRLFDPEGLFLGKAGTGAQADRGLDQAKSRRDSYVAT